MKNIFAWLLMMVLITGNVFAQDVVQEVQTISVKDNIHVLISPSGGNVVVSSGEDGVFLVDDQLKGRSEIIENAVKVISDQPIKFILNTHYHFDHAGGNEFFGAKDVIIVSHNNVRKRLTSKQFITFFNREMEPMSEEGLPMVTFSENMSLYYNNNDIRMIHMAAAHTDGDSIVQFVESNVIAAGDLIFNESYPFIDTEHGGSINGLISGLDVILRLADDKTVIIPGHGNVMNKKELVKYRNMLDKISDNIEKLIFDKKTLEETIAAKPTAAFDKTFGSGRITPDQFVAILYENLK